MDLSSEFFFFAFQFRLKKFVKCCIIGKSKEEIREKLQEYYPKLKDKNFTIENIHGCYGYDDYGDWVTCQGSIPQAIIAFLDSISF